MGTVPSVDNEVDIGQENTHNANGIEQTVLHEGICETDIVATPATGVAIADGVEYPREVHTGATAREEEIVIEFVPLRGAAL